MLPAVFSSLERQKQCPAIGRFQQPHSRFAAPQKPVRSTYFALGFFRLKPGLVFVGFVKRTYSNLDWVRLALPRSPESGFAVSAHAKNLSREKRNISLRNFLNVYT